MNNGAMLRKTTVVRTVEELVAAFGGTKAMAQWADVGPSAVSNWISLESVPRGYHLRLYLEIQRRGILADPSLFGMPDDPPAEKKVETSAAA